MDTPTSIDWTGHRPPGGSCFGGAVLHWETLEAPERSCAPPPAPDRVHRDESKPREAPPPGRFTCTTRDVLA